MVHARIRLEYRVNLMSEIKVACRASPLAQAQSQILLSAIEKKGQLVLCDSRLDLHQDNSIRDLDPSLHSFTKEVDLLVQAGQADLGCHSAKDMGLELANGLSAYCFVERDIPNDAWVGPSPEDLPPGSVVGTDSPRREHIIKQQYPHLVVKSIRGNIGTRLRKFQEGQYDALVLAACGLKRLNVSLNYQLLPLDIFVPAMNQGIILTTISDLHVEHDNLRAREHQHTRSSFDIERTIGQALQLSCNDPIGIYADTNGFVRLYMGHIKRWYTFDTTSNHSLDNWLEGIKNG